MLHVQTHDRREFVVHVQVFWGWLGCPSAGAAGAGGAGAA